MFLKIRSLAKLSFKEINNYKFTSKNGSIITMCFFGKSRIDGLPIFKKIKGYNKSLEPLTDFYYKNIKIDGVISTATGKSYTEETDYSEDFLDFIVDFYKIDRTSFESESGFKKLKRQFKLNSLLE